MRILAFLMTAMMVSATGRGLAQQGQAADEEAARKLLEQYAAAFNKKDAKAVAELWAEDGDYTSLRGRTAKGRAELEGLFRDLLSGPYRDAKIELITSSVRLLAPDVALGHATWQVNGALGPDGKAGPTVRTVSLSVATRRGGQWRIVSALPLLLPTPAAK